MPWKAMLGAAAKKKTAFKYKNHHQDNKNNNLSIASMQRRQGT
jgi:hypothetical protein